MADLVLKCDACGHEMRVNEFAIGAKGSCAQCGAKLVVSMANTRPLEDETLQVMPTGLGGHEQETRALPIVDGKHCARCGRAFRGDWDQYESKLGVICHICANLVQGADKQQETIGEVKPVTAAFNREGIDMPDMPLPPPRPEIAAAKKREAILQRAALFAALGMVVFAILLTVFVDFDTEVPPADEATESTASQGKDSEDPSLPPWAYFAVKGIGFGLSFLAKLLTLYFLLSWAKKLPNDNIPANVIALSVVALGLAVLDLVVGFAAQIPIVGCVWPILGLAITLYIVWSLYNLSISELLLYFVASLLAFLTVRIIELTVLGAFAQLVL